MDRTDGGGLSVLTGNRVTLLSRKTDHTLGDGAWSWGALYIMADVEKETGSSMQVEKSCFACSLSKQWSRWLNFPNREEKSHLATQGELTLPVSLFPIVNCFSRIHH